MKLKRFQLEKVGNIFLEKGYVGLFGRMELRKIIRVKRAKVFSVLYIYNNISHRNVRTVMRKISFTFTLQSFGWLKFLFTL